MNKVEFAVDLTKTVVQCCAKLKWDFKENIKSYFEDNASFVEEIIKKRKIKEEDIEEEIQYTSQIFKSLNGDVEKKNSSLESEKEKISSVDGLKKLNAELRSEKIQKIDIEKITGFLDRYPKMGLEERKELKTVLENFKVVREGHDDLKALTVYCEVNANLQDAIRIKVFKSVIVDQDWEEIERALREAITKGNQERIWSVVKRIKDSLPSCLNERMKEELDDVRKLLLKVVSMVDIGKTRVKVLKILKKFWNEMDEKSKNAEMTGKEFDSEYSNKRAINTADACKAVLGKKYR